MLMHERKGICSTYSGYSVKPGYIAVYTGECTCVAVLFLLDISIINITIYTVRNNYRPMI